MCISIDKSKKTKTSPRKRTARGRRREQNGSGLLQPIAIFLGNHYENET